MPKWVNVLHKSLQNYCETIKKQLNLHDYIAPNPEQLQLESIWKAFWRQHLIQYQKPDETNWKIKAWNENNTHVFLFKAGQALLIKYRAASYLTIPQVGGQIHERSDVRYNGQGSRPRGVMAYSCVREMPLCN